MAMSTPTSRSGRGSGLPSDRKKNQVLLPEGTAPPMVSKEIFDAVQEKFAGEQDGLTEE